MLAEEEFATSIHTPTLEKVPVSLNSSMRYRKFNDEEPNGDPVWHYHPEIELVFIQSGHGKRQIGNHISYYTAGDLLLLGPNLPHYGFSNRLTKKNTEIVIHFLPDFIPLLEKTPELRSIADLIEKSKHGISFKGKTKVSIGRMLESLDIQNPFQRLLGLLEALHTMSNSEEYNLLNVGHIAIQSNQQDKERIKEVYDYVRAHFQEEISIQDIAELISMTEPSFCRFFKKQTGNTFTKFVNEFRVIHACKLLSETSRPISDVCYDCGFNNFSNFNKQFKKFTSKSPSDYRGEFKEVISSAMMTTSAIDIE